MPTINHRRITMDYGGHGAPRLCPPYVLTTASVEMKWKNGWSAAATFEDEFRTSRAPAGKGVVRYQW